MLDEHHLDVNFDHRPSYKYHLNGEEKVLMEGEENHHEKLFWGGKEGTEIIFGYIRVELVMIAVYIGCFVVALQPAIWEAFGNTTEETKDIVSPMIIYFIAIIPVIMHVNAYTNILANYAIVTSVEEMIQAKGINRTLRIMKSRNAMLALHNMSCFMHSVDRLAHKMRNDAFKFECFAHLSTEAKQEILDTCDAKRLPAGKTILSYGQKNNKFYILVDGEVEILDANNASLGEHVSGEVFGENSMVNKTNVKCNAVAKTAVTLLILSESDYLKHLASGRLEEEQGSKNESEAERARKAHARHEKERARSPTPMKKSAMHKQHQGRIEDALKFYRRVALSKIYKTIDNSGDGSIDQEELETFLGALFPESDDSESYRKQLTLMIQGLDDDGDGDVTEDEFLKMMEPIVEEEEQRETMESMAERMFEILDDDGSGALTTSEFKEKLESLGIDMSYEEIRELFHEYDEDLDGVLDDEEFVALMTHQL